LAEARSFPETAVPVLKHGYRMQWEPAQEGYVLLYPEGMVALNDSAAEILKRCDGERTVGQLVTELQEAFPDVDVEPDIHEFLEVGHEQGWIEARGDS